MKTFLLLSLLINLAIIATVSGQERTNEKKWTIDPQPVIQYIPKQ